MTAMIRELRDAPRAESADRIYVPGEMEWERYEEAHSVGMKLPDYVLVNFLTVAEQIGARDQFESVFRQ